MSNSERVICRAAISGPNLATAVAIGSPRAKAQHVAPGGLPISGRPPGYTGDRHRASGSSLSDATRWEIGTPPTVSHVLSRDSHPSCVDGTRVACPTPTVDPCRWMAVCPISKPARTLAERLPLDRSSADLPERCDRVDHPATPRVQRDRLCARPRSAPDGRATVVGAHQRDRARTPRSARRSGPGRGLRTRTASAACPATPSRSWSRVFR